MHQPVRRATTALVVVAVAIAAIAIGANPFGSSVAGAAVSQGLACGLGGNQTMTVTGTAPATVAPGGTFGVDLDIAQAKADGGKIKDLVWSFQAPAGSEVVAGSATTVGTGSGTLGAVTTAISGSVVQLKVAGEIANGATFKPPVLRFSLKATGAAGTDLAVKVRSNPAYTLTALGSIKISCTAKDPVVAFTTTKVQATGSTTGSSTTVTPTTTDAPTTVVWGPTVACGTVASTTAPADAVSMSITAAGAKGGKGGQVAGATGGSGAHGGRATATFPVVAGQTITAVRGCNGSNGGSGSGPAGAGFSTGGNGGQGHGVLTSDHYGGGGGGSTAVCRSTNCLSGAGSTTPLVVAGGGGGGGSLNCAGTSVGSGGAGGAGSVTSDGAGAGASGSAGGNGLHSSGGAGGVNSTPGVATGGTGGNGSQGSGTNSGGGGGGGGWHGGTGGTGTSGGAALCAGGGGAGGGSSWVASTGTATSFGTATGDADFTVTFTVDPPEPVVDHVPFATLDALITQQYLDFLGRAPTAQELGDWRDLIEGGTKTADDLIFSLLDTDQTTDDARVVRLYLAYFKRPPDLPGLQFWLGELAAGKSLQKASDQFAGTAEFKRLYGSLSDLQFVELIYTNVLGRPAEPSGRDYWTDQLARKVRTRGWVMTYFSESAENRTRKTAHVGAVRIHLAMLERMPTKAELEAAVATVISKDQTVAEALTDLAHDIRHGAEYAARVT